MARTNVFQPTDVYVLMNEISKQATGRSDLTAIDTTSFVSVGETVLRTGYENTLNAISTVLSQTIFSVRPYRAKLRSLYVPEQRWGAITRKITPLSMDFEASQDWNTDINPTQLADGQSIDMYKIKAPKAVELHFTGSNVLQIHITRFSTQLRMAFRNEGEFMQFINAIMVEFYNEIETANENKTRLTLLNYIAGLMQMNLEVVDLVAEYNLAKGTTYTREEIMKDHLTEFMQFFVPQVKTISDLMTERSALYHASLTGYQTILRHTPKQRQRMYMYNPFFTMAESRVFSEIFHPLYLELGQNFERVNYWQDIKEPTKVNIKPAILDTATGEMKNGVQTEIPYVLGVLFDEEAVGVMPQFDEATSTPYNSAGRYYNMFMHWQFRSYVDYTENGVLFILGEGGAPAQSSRLRKAVK